MPIYHYILMSENDFINNLVLEELLRERSNYYLMKNKPIDFWVLYNPPFIRDNIANTILKSYYYKNLCNNNKFINNYSCLLSTNLNFIYWIKLRLGFFENINEIELTNSINNCVDSNGLYGNINHLELFKEKNFKIFYNTLNINKVITSRIIKKIIEKSNC